MKVTSLKGKKSRGGPVVTKPYISSCGFSVYISICSYQLADLGGLLNASHGSLLMVFNVANQAPMNSCVALTLRCGRALLRTRLLQ